MKQYLKMGEHFSGVVNVDNDGNVSDDKFHRGSLGDFDEKYFEVIANAINSHDELVQMNQELLAALEEGRRAIGEHSAPYDCYATGPITGDAFRDLVQCPACSFIAMYDDAIAKSKGGAA